MKNIITLKDASGNDVEFKMLDQFTYDERTYVVLMPHNESTTQVSIFEVVPTKEEGVDGLLGVTPDQTNILFEVFKERNKDKFNFVEEWANSLFFLSVPGMALIQSEIVRPQVVTTKCSEPQADTIKVGVKEVE